MFCMELSTTLPNFSFASRVVFELKIPKLRYDTELTQTLQTFIKVLKISINCLPKILIKFGNIVNTSDYNVAKLQLDRLNS